MTCSHRSVAGRLTIILDKPDGPQSRGYRNRAKIDLNFSTVVSGQNFRSVISAVSNAKCSGQFGSVGICGTTFTITFLAVSAFASKWLRTVCAETGSSSIFQQS